MKFKSNTSSKNDLIKRLSELTGKAAVYTGAPAFSYNIGDYHVERDGSLEVDEERAERIVIGTLVREKLIESEEQIIPLPPEEPHPKLETMLETSRDGTITERSRRTYDGPVVVKDRFIPVQTMINLINMIGAKGEILSKSVGKPNAFWISENIIYDIPYEHPTTFNELNHILLTGNGNMVKGIEFTPTSVSFTGFPKTNDIVVRGAYETLAEAMYKYAATVKWISPRKMNNTNEKYYFHIWMNHIQLGGRQYKTYRAVLMQNLDGNCSYRTKTQQIAHRYYYESKKKEAEKMAAGTNEM